MRLMQELNENVDYLIEGESHNKSYYISGVFMQAETPNRNGRFYPRPVMESRYLNTNRNTSSQNEL